MKFKLLTCAILAGLFVFNQFQTSLAGPLKAGVASVDVSPVKFPVIVNGGFLGQSDTSSG